MSLVGALTPLGKVATRRSAWVAHVTAYTLAGTLSSVAVGAGLGALGATVLAPGLDAPRLAALVLLTALAALQVSGVLRVSPPEIGRQTNGRWARGPGLLSSALWGLDLGLLFTTFFTFAGVWALVGVAVLAASPAFGAALLVAYWAGRALSVWVAPRLVHDARATPALVSALHRRHPLLRQIHVAGLVWMLLALAAMLIMRSQ